MSILENTQLIASLQKDQNSFHKQSKEIKNDKTIVLELLPRFPHIFNHISKQLKEDKEVVLTAIKSASYNFHLLKSKQQKDKEIFLLAVNQYGLMLESFPHFSDDKNVVLTAVNQNGKSVKYASDRLRKDIDIAKSAMRIDPNNFLYLDSSLSDNRELFLYAVSKNGFALKYAADTIKDDEEIVLIACQYNQEVIKFASDRLQQKINNNTIENNTKNSIEATNYTDQTSFIVEKAKNIRNKSFNNKQKSTPTVLQL